MMKSSPSLSARVCSELARVIRTHSDERYATRIAKAIDRMQGFLLEQKA